MSDDTRPLVLHGSTRCTRSAWQSWSRSVYHGIQKPELGSVWDRVGIIFNYCLLLQGWTKLPVDWNTPAWSLSCELFFYACFPLILVLLGRRSWKKLAVVTAFSVLIPILVHTANLPYKAFIYFGDFLIGIAVAMLYQLLQQRGTNLLGRGHLLYLPALVAGMGLVIVADSVHPWVLFDGLMRFSNAALILGLSFGGGPLHRLLSSKLIFTGGMASYGIYILHVPLLWWYKRTYFYLGLPPVAAGMVFFALVVILSFAACRWIELPANDLIRSKLNALLRRRSSSRSRTAAPAFYSRFMHLQDE